MKFLRFHFIVGFCFLFFISCSKYEPIEYPNFETWKAYDEAVQIDSSMNNPNPKLRYKTIQSKILDKNDILENITPQLGGFNQEMYDKLFPFVFEKSIPELQQAIAEGNLSYKLLTQWFLYRIAHFETDKELGLNTILAINPNAVIQAEKYDQESKQNNFLVYGMPILLKDNINSLNIRTTAGAKVLFDHYPKTDAAIVKNLKSQGAIILGKVNLSEWANFFCANCPNGFSVVGGQTLNPYGPRRFDTGGSSSGSASSIAANYAVGAIGSETSGSILSPASQQSLVGLKPTVKPENQKGIIPISSTLDTPGPITKSVIDARIIYQAMLNHKTFEDQNTRLEPALVRLGVFQSYMLDSLYSRSIDVLKDKGFEIVMVKPKQMDFDGFLALLNGDMKRDLKSYLEQYASDPVSVKHIEDIINFNKQDSLTNMPYNQERFDGIMEQDLSDKTLDSLRQKLLKSGKNYFESFMIPNYLNAVVSINNYNASQAALAKYPAITVPMGYRTSGEPAGITFIVPSDNEEFLLQLADYFETFTSYRQSPKDYR